jgi:hypothetical protein
MTVMDEPVTVVAVVAEPSDELVLVDALVARDEDLSVELPHAAPMRTITTSGNARRTQLRVLM